MPQLALIEIDATIAMVASQWLGWNLRWIFLLSCNLTNTGAGWLSHEYLSYFPGGAWSGFTIKTTFSILGGIKERSIFLFLSEFNFQIQKDYAIERINYLET